MTVAFLPNAGFLSEVSRGVAIASALRDRGVAVAFATRGGPYVDLISEAGFEVHDLRPAMDAQASRAFLDALLGIGKGGAPLYADDELHAAVDAEVEFLQRIGSVAVVTGFTLSAFVSARAAGIPLITDHGGSFVAPVLAAGLAPAPVNPPSVTLLRLPHRVQRALATYVPVLMRKPARPLNRLAGQMGQDRIPGLLGLMAGDLTLVTEDPGVLGVSKEAIEDWSPRWPFRTRPGTTFRCTGPLFARLDVPVPDRVAEFLDEEGPVVYLSPTSVSEELLRSLVGAVRASGARVLVGATIHEIGDLGDDQTLVAGVLPNHEIMGRVDAAVIMGGQGSVQTALAAGTPFVGLPYHPEQELNVAVAERLGAAVRIRPDAEPTAIAAAVRRILAEPSFRTAARRVADVYSKHDGAQQAASAIIDLLGPGMSRVAAA